MEVSSAQRVRYNDKKKVAKRPNQGNSIDENVSLPVFESQNTGESIDLDNTNESVPTKTNKVGQSPLKMRKHTGTKTSRALGLKDIETSISSIYTSRQKTKKSSKKIESSELRRREDSLASPIQEPKTANVKTRNEDNSPGEQSQKTPNSVPGKSQHWKPKSQFVSQDNSPMYPGMFSAKNQKISILKVNKSQSRDLSRFGDTMATESSERLDGKLFTQPDYPQTDRHFIINDLEVMYLDDIKKEKGLEVLKTSMQTKVSPYGVQFLRKNNTRREEQTKIVSDKSYGKLVERDPVISQLYNPYNPNMSFQKPVNASLMNKEKLILQEFGKKAEVLRNLKTLNDELQSEAKAYKSENEHTKSIVLPEIATERTAVKNLRIAEILNPYQPRASIKPLKEYMSKYKRE